jgi:hypothetical protein
MSARAARLLLAAIAAPFALLVQLVATASPAAAHNVGGGSLPAPTWLLGYVGAFAVVATAIALRSSWPTARLRVAVGAAALEADTDSAMGVAGGIDAERSGARRWAAASGHGLGLALLVAVFVAAVVGPDSGAANIAPVAVFVIWWVGLPVLCLVVGDVMRVINPFVAFVALGERLLGRPDATGEATGAPSWTAAAFLWGFSWFYLAYHRPGSPRAVAVLLVVYTAAAVAGGLRWGRGWLRTGEAFAALSEAAARLTRPRGRPRPPGLLALVVVWVGATAFDGLAATTFWVDVEGTTQGWSRTLVNTIGFVWITAVVGAIVLVALRVTDRADTMDESTDAASDGRVLVRRILGVALVPLAVGWFVAHDLTFFLFEGQNFLALLSDPIGRGWDLFGTIGRTIDYTIVRDGWVRWVQLGALLLGHTVAVVLAHDAALRLRGRRRGMRLTWTVAGIGAVSIVGASLLVLG